MRTFISLLVQAAFALSANAAYAYDLGKVGCGGMYGGINLEFDSTIRDEDDLRSKISRISWSRKRYYVDENFYDDRTQDYKNIEYTSLKEEVLRAWSYRNTQGRDWRNIFTPIGSEEFVAQSLHDNDIIISAGYPAGYCGGGEISYFVIRDTLFDLRRPEVFERFLFNALDKFSRLKAGELSVLGSVDDGRLYVSPIDPYYPTKRYTVIVPSEISRGTKSNSVWDRFDVVFSLYKYTTYEFVVEVHSENLKFAPRVESRQTPPSVEHFRENSDENDYESEYIVASSIARFIGGLPSNCVVEAEVYSSSSSDLLLCTGDMEEFASSR